MKKQSTAYNIFTIFNLLLFILFAFLCAYPFYFIIVNSFNGTAGDTAFIFPSKATVENYKTIFSQQSLPRAIFISFARSIVGTIITLGMSSLYAFVLTQDELPARKVIYRLTVATMYFSAGVVPTYVAMVRYGLKDNFLIYVLPSAISVYNMILIKTYMEQIDSAIVESAVIDGAGPFTTFTRIVLPVSIPILATVAVFSVVGQWNAWYDNFLYVSNPNLQTLQYTAHKLIGQADAIARRAMMGESVAEIAKVKISSKDIRMAISVITVLPVMLFYPFMQRYFVEGIMLGAVKG